MNLKSRLQEIETRMSAIQTEIDAEGADLDALNNEIDQLSTEKRGIQMKQKVTEGLNTGEIEARNIAKPVATVDKQPTEQEVRTKRGEQLKEQRAVTVASGDLVLPKHTASDIKGTFNQVSTLVDRVKHVPLNGGESYERAYEKGHGEGGYTVEGADYNESDVQFGYATIGKAKITAYSEESEETVKLPAADYDSLVVNGVGKALRKKITREILVGTGGTNQLVGIFSANATAIEPATDLEVSAVNADTLDNIIFSFGGNEDVEDAAVLILSKSDVKAFAMLRDGNDKKVYDVKSQGNTGTIDGVPYIINSACKPLAQAAEGEFAMAYGPLSNYELATFSPTDIQRSTDFKFKQGMIAHKGSVFVGGNVAAHNGFLRVKKAPVA
ncbi:MULTISPECIES: phage major capsid protein [unclassified Sutcliffiella]|uniref:phage major capsid protein n=1 Tax=unclassified Sutcliffiella TaxID=2837532 RepID=UPI0030CF2F9C